jgi:hypothetical protein
MKYIFYVHNIRIDRRLKSGSVWSSNFLLAIMQMAAFNSLETNCWYVLGYWLLI